MMSRKVIFSVVIPAYNYAETLPRAVSSVVSQMEGCPVELLVIDDGSTDNTPAVVARLSEIYLGKFRYIRKENGGLSSVRNRGIEEAKGDYLIFLDADDEMAPGAICEYLKHLQAYPETRFIIGGHVSVASDGVRRQHLPSQLPSVSYERVRAYLISKTLALANGACAMHRDVFSRGQYPEKFRSAEDIPVFAQCLAYFSCSVITQPLALIYKHDDSLRHQFDHAKAGGVALVDEVFLPSRLGQEFAPLKREFLVQRLLSLFRSAYLAKDQGAAKSYFSTAVRQDFRVLLKLSYSGKALRMLLRLV